MAAILEWAMAGLGVVGAFWSFANRYWFLFVLSLVLLILGLVFAI